MPNLFTDIRASDRNRTGQSIVGNETSHLAALAAPGSTHSGLKLIVQHGKWCTTKLTCSADQAAQIVESEGIEPVLMP